MSLRNVDIQSGLRRVAEKRVEEAMREGKFDNLPGAGKPLDLDPIPADENARMTWWALRIMRKNDFLPHEVQWRKQIDGIRSTIENVSDESKLDSLVQKANALIHSLNTLGTNAINLPIAPLSLDAERNRFRQRQAGSP